MLEFLILIRDVLLSVLMSWAGLDSTDSQDRKESPADRQESAYILPVNDTDCDCKTTQLVRADLHAS